MTARREGIGWHCNQHPRARARARACTRAGELLCLGCLSWLFLLTRGLEDSKAVTVITVGFKWVTSYQMTSKVLVYEPMCFLSAQLCDTGLPLHIQPSHPQCHRITEERIRIWITLSISRIWLLGSALSII